MFKTVLDKMFKTSIVYNNIFYLLKSILYSTKNCIGSKVSSNTTFSKVSNMKHLIVIHIVIINNGLKNFNNCNNECEQITFSSINMHVIRVQESTKKK